MKISVVIPTRDRHDCLKRVLPTYLEQPEVGEVILVDDQSMPPLSPNFFQDPRIRILRADRPLGCPAARNAGVEAASYDWILHTDDDVYLAPGYVRGCFHTLQANHADLVCGRRIYIGDGQTEWQARMHYDEMDPAQAYNPFLVMFHPSAPVPDEQPILVPQTTSLMRRELCLEHPYDNAFGPPSFYREDTDFHFRVARGGGRLWWSPDALCYHLPPSAMKGGGCHIGSPLLSEISVIRNNLLFLKRHYEWLLQVEGVSGSLFRNQLRFSAWRIARRLNLENQLWKFTALFSPILARGKSSRASV